MAVKTAPGPIFGCDLRSRSHPTSRLLRLAEATHPASKGTIRRRARRVMSHIARPVKAKIAGKRPDTQTRTRQTQPKPCPK